jgi:hypothetical protein
MRSILLSGILLLNSQAVECVLFPTLIDPVIRSCSSNGCVTATYASGGTRLVDVVPLGPPDPRFGTRLVAIGVHCSAGTQLQPPRPFTSCSYDEGPAHSPSLSNCHLRSTASWELTPDSTCSTTTAWGTHRGAGPGGECVLFIQEGGVINPRGTVTSIYGSATAEVVANSGNAFCQKPLPPNVTCDVLLPATIDHGTVGPNSSSSVSIEGQLSCGANPVVSFLGGDRLALAPGVTTNLTASVVGAGRIQITSDLVSLGGETGYHSASTVIVVSPY